MYRDVAKNIENFVIKYPKTIVPNPSDDDYETGYINRYFIRKTNDVNGSVFEVDVNVYNEYKSNPFWKTANIRWRISGPTNAIYDDMGKLTDTGVLVSNKAAIASIFKTIRNIGLYLPNPLQFHI